MTFRVSVSVAAWLTLAAGPALRGAGPPEERIQRVENGLLRANTIRGSALERLKLAERMSHYKVPGVSVAVVHEGRLEWARGYGQADVESGKAVAADTVFQAASVSKPVAAMTALRLVELGKLSLDEDVNLKLRSWKVPENEFTKTEKVTLRRLLSHNAGLTVHGFPGYAQGAAVPTLVQLLDAQPPANTAAARVDKTPGSGFRYAGGGYAVMQLLVEDVTGKPFDQVARELVLEPLGMRHSTYQQPLAEPLARDAATAYRGDGQPVAGRWHTYPEKTAAGLWTTPADFARIIVEIQKPGRMLRPETVRTMLTKSAGDYGLGFGIGDTDGRASFSHGGANEGFRCQFFAYRDSGEGAMVMTNGDNGGALANEILRAIAAEYGWVDFRTKERTVVTLDPAVLQAYVGDYQFPGGPTVNVRLKEGRLIAGVGGDNVDLVADSADSFFDMDGTAPDVKFVKQADGSFDLNAAGGTAKRKK